MILLLVLLATPVWAGTLPYETSCDVQRGSASAALCAALNATVALKLQANLADNKKAEQLATQAETLVLKALGLATNAEKLLKPIPVP